MMFEPRFDVPVLPAIFQIVELPNTNWMPSHISVQNPWRPESDVGFGDGSGRRIHHNDSTETRNDAASTATARAAPTTWIRKPASAGPTSCPTDPLTWTFE